MLHLCGWHMEYTMNLVSGHACITVCLGTHFATCCLKAEKDAAVEELATLLLSVPNWTHPTVVSVSCISQLCCSDGFSCAHLWTYYTIASWRLLTSKSSKDSRSTER